MILRHDAARPSLYDSHDGAWFSHYFSPTGRSLIQSLGLSDRTGLGSLLPSGMTRLGPVIMTLRQYGA
ncbi:hypothetical protein DPMN_129507 [Dreissena polymorpha]|uniref:Uncharacterized protein n=1 Tax=Dreissena polymorpha TaxID=45954 RepID=A0A9D4JWQ2_DREPO|nr:hypothetical protein DPMN_129507 [Dreissena polymorpha]